MSKNAFKVKDGPKQPTPQQLMSIFRTYGKRARERRGKGTE